MVDSPIENDDPQYAKQLLIVTFLWMVLVLGAGVLMIYFL